MRFSKSSSLFPDCEPDPALWPFRQTSLWPDELRLGTGCRPDSVDSLVITFCNLAPEEPAVTDFVSLLLLVEVRPNGDTTSRALPGDGETRCTAARSGAGWTGNGWLRRSMSLLAAMVG